MRIQIDENSVTLTPFGSLPRINPGNASPGGDKSWIEILRTALSQAAGERRSDKTPAD